MGTDRYRLDDEEIGRLYCVEHLTLREIAARVGCRSEGPIRLRLRRSGICLRHYTESQRLRRADGVPTKHRGERRKMIGGYILVRMPNHPDANSQGYIMEHRLVMEGVLGRRLAPNEEVHHRNRTKDDNRPENLEVVTRSDHRHLHATTCEEALSIVAEAAVAFGGRPTYQFMQQTHRRLGPVLRAFGTWKQALAAGGFDAPRGGAKPKAPA